MRINKALSHFGIASRRKADDLIKAGEVKINGKVANLGDSIDIERDTLTINGTEFSMNDKIHEDYEYILLNKPLKVLSSVTDDRARITVCDLVESENKLVPVGRLDYMSEGLILLTNDGELTYKMTHPSFHVEKVYVVQVKEALKAYHLDTLARGGFKIEGKIVQPTKVKKLGPHKFEMVLNQGIKRQIRLSCQYVGLNVVGLKRTAIGELQLKGIQPGEWRSINENEREWIEQIKSK